MLNMAEKRLVAGINPSVAEEVREKASTLGVTDNAFVNRCVEECLQLMNSPGVWRPPFLVRDYRRLMGERTELTPALEKLLELLFADVVEDSQRHGLLIMLIEAVQVSGFEVTAETAKALAAFCKTKVKPKADSFRQVESIGGFEVVEDESSGCFRIRNAAGDVAGRFKQLRDARNFLHPKIK